MLSGVIVAVLGVKLVVVCIAVVVVVVIFVVLSFGAIVVESF